MSSEDMGERPLPGVVGAVVREVPALPAELAGTMRVAPHSVARPGALLRDSPGLARFLARDGRVVEVAAEPGAERAVIEALLQGSLAAALIHQRGELPLHGATLIPPGGGPALAVVGPQGAGKSTLAYELVRRGWQLVSDDLTHLTHAGDAILAWPGRPGIKLCRDACLGFGLDPKQLATVAGERDKCLLPVPGQASAPVTLGCVVAIERQPGVQCTVVAGLEAMALVSRNTFRAHYIQALGQLQAHMQLTGAIAARVRLLRLAGPGLPGEVADRLRHAVCTDMVTGGDARAGSGRPPP